MIIKMKRGILLLLSLIFLTNFIYAEIIITQQPDSFYNLGDIISVPIKITSLISVSDFFKANLICNGIETEVFRNYIILGAGEEETQKVKIPLISRFTGKLAGSCVIKSYLGEEFTLTNEFKISNIINTVLTNQPTEIAPGEKLIIIGTAQKENRDLANGFIDVVIVTDDGELQSSETINQGYFEINISIPKNLRAGQHLVKINLYEKDSEGEITNKGFIDYNLLITQVLTSLEVAFENPEIEPNNNLKVKAILHDQTGEKINSKAKITIKDQNGKLINEKEVATDEYIESFIEHNQPASEWKAYAVSGKLTGEATLKIIELRKVEILIINKTITIKNIGNVNYNGTIPIKIGEKQENINVELESDKEQKYILSAPEGEYEIEVMGQTQTVALTGGTIGVKKSSLMNKLNLSFIWLFIIGILGFVSYLFFKKGYNRTFIGYITKKREEKSEPLRRDSLVKSKNKAELSLSIKGTKQNIDLICLKIKNLKDIEKKKGDIEATIQQIVDAAENNKAITYENQDNIFFLFVPMKTKTFRNEKVALQTAQNIKRILDHSNKLFKDKIDYGIGLNYGTIVAKQEPESFKFMSMGTLITEAKKISSSSKGEILISEKMKDKSATDVKTEKITAGKNPEYKIKEMKTESEDNKRFLANFVKRLEGHK